MTRLKPAIVFHLLWAHYLKVMVVGGSQWETTTKQEARAAGLGLGVLNSKGL